MNFFIQNYCQTKSLYELKIFYFFPSSHLLKKRPQKNIIRVVFLIQQKIPLDPV